MGIPTELIAAYRAAAYEADNGESTICFRVGERNAALDSVLEKNGAGGAVLITAYNPRSRKRSAADNAAAHRALLDAAAAYRHLPARGRDPDGAWPAEPGLFILDLSRDEGLALARRFDQYAIVWITRGEAPALLPAV